MKKHSRVKMVTGAAAAALALSVMTAHPAPLIYEPFSQTAGSLNGKAGGTGLSGNWSVNQTVNVVDTPTLSYGDLLHTGGQATLNYGNGVDAWVSTSSVLGDNHLLDDGATLWFSTMFYKTGSGGGVNEKGGFALGTDRLDGAYNGTNMTNGGSGLGFAPIATSLKAASWSGGGNVSTGGGTSLSLSTDTFIVGKIAWGATGSDDETVTIYTPSTTDLTTLGTGWTQTLASVDQTAFDTISFTSRNAGTASDTIVYDEIRFGATYADVTPKTPYDGTWNADADSNWSATGNWVGGTVADGADKTATFDNVLTVDRTVTLDSDRTIGNITYLDTDKNLTIAPTVAEVLTLSTTSGTPTINTGNKTLTISAPVAGTNGLTKTGTGTLKLTNAANTFSGDISVEQGTLTFSNGNDGVTRTLGGGNFTGNIDIASGATLEYWTSGSTGTPQEFSGDISGGGTLKLGYNGYYKLTGSGSTFTGTTQVFGQYNGRTSKLETPFLSNLGSKLIIGTGSSQSGAFFYYTGAGETSGMNVQIDTNGNSDKGISNLGTGTLTFTTPWTANATSVRTFTVETTSDLILQGFNLPSNIKDFDKKGAGKLSVSGPSKIWNSVDLYGGTLEVGSEINDGGVPGSLGIAPSDQNRLNWRGDATLRYTGPDNSTNRGFTVDNGKTATWDIANAATTLTVTGGTAATSGNLAKTGDGALALGGTVSVNNVDVLQGALLVNGSLTSSTGITVASGATLGGIGSITGDTTINGTLSPGNSPGQLTLSSLTLSGTSNTPMQIGGTTLGTEYDNITIQSGGALTYGGDLTVDNYGGYDMDLASNVYDLFTLNGVTPTGDFASVTVNSQSLTNTSGLWEWTSGDATLSYAFDQSDGNLSITVVIPEPSTIILGALGLMGLTFRRRRRK